VITVAVVAVLVKQPFEVKVVIFFEGDGVLSAPIIPPFIDDVLDIL
jgi:hypothetical protein